VHASLLRHPVRALLAGAIALAQAPANTYVVYNFGQPASLDPVPAPTTPPPAPSSRTSTRRCSPSTTRRSTELKPALATSYEILNDGLTYRFQLRPDVQFHSGNTMTCGRGLVDQVRPRHRAPEGATSYLLGKQFVGSQQTGDDPAAYLAEVTWDEIDGAVTCPEGPDGLVADLNIQAPDPAFLAVLAYTAFSVIDSQWAIANGVWDGTEATWQDWIGRDLTGEFLHRNMSGTGAYQLVEWGDASMIATRFDGYWGGAPRSRTSCSTTSTRKPPASWRCSRATPTASTSVSAPAWCRSAARPASRPRGARLGPHLRSAGFFNFDIDTTDNVDVGSGQLDGAASRRLLRRRQRAARLRAPVRPGRVHRPGLPGRREPS
jgi:ABC-type transport system substrate-binding protein